MRYDRGWAGRRDRTQGYGWEYRWEDGSRGYDQGYLQGRERTGRYERPWVGGYGGETQGGSGGYPVNTSGYLQRDRTIAGRPRGSHYDRNFAEDAERNGVRRRPGGARMRGGYDVDHDVRPEDYRPAYSPVGGMYPAMGGAYRKGRVPGPLRDAEWTSRWTRWF